MVTVQGERQEGPGGKTSHEDETESFTEWERGDREGLRFIGQANGGEGTVNQAEIGTFPSVCPWTDDGAL